jgi:WD40 repeat protein
VTTLVFTNDGNALLSAGIDGTVRTWNVDDLKQTRLLDAGASVTRLAVSTTGEIAAATTDDEIVVWTLETNLPKKFRAHTETVRMLTYAPDDVLLSGGDDGRLIRHDPNGPVILRTLANTSYVAVAFSPNRQQIAVATVDAIRSKPFARFSPHVWGLRIQVWDPRFTVLVAQVAREWHGPKGKRPALLQFIDSKTIGYADADGLWVWEFQGNGARSLTDEAIVSACAFDPTGTVAAWATDDGTHVMNIRRGTIRWFMNVGTVTSLALSPHGRHVAIGLEDGRMTVRPLGRS